MNYALIREYHAARPFRPFTVITADGRAARVLHPEFMALDGNEEIIMVTDPEASHCIIDADSITALENIPKIPTASQSVGANAEKSKRRHAALLRFEKCGKQPP